MAGIFLSTMGTNSQEQLVTVSTAEMAEVYQFACTDEFTGAALNKIDAAVFQGQLSVKIDTTRGDTEVSQDQQNVIRNEWGGGKSGSKLLKYMFMFGFAVVRPEPHLTLMGEWTYHVVPWNKMQLQFTESSRGRRRYFVTFTDDSFPTATVEELTEKTWYSEKDKEGNAIEGYLDAVRSPDKKPKRTVTLPKPTVDSSILKIQANPNNVGYPKIDGSRAHLIYVPYEPTTDGALQSPIALIRRNMLIMKHWMGDEAYATHWRAHPLHVVEVTKNVLNGGGGGTTGREYFGVGQFAEADIKQDADKYRFQLNEAERRDMQLSSHAAAEGRQVLARDLDNYQKQMHSLTSASKHTESANPNSLVSPSDGHNIVMGVNQQMKPGPVPDGSNNFEKMREAILSMAFAILNIVPQVMNPQGTKYQSDPATVLREWNTAIQSVQQILQPMLVEIYEACYSGGMSNYINALYKMAKTEADRLDQEKKKIDDEGKKRRPASAEYNPESTEGNMTKKQFMEMLKKNGDTDLLGQIKGERKQTAKQFLVKTVQVSFSFNFTPENTLQDLQSLFSMYVISEDTFVRMAGRQCRIGIEDILLDQKDRDKEKKRRLAEKQETLETELATKQKFAPPDKGGVGGGPPPKGFGTLAEGGGGGGSEPPKKKQKS